VIEAYEAGATMAALAKKYDVKRETISKLLRGEGATLRVRRSMSQAEIDHAVQLYVSGLSLQRIGEQLGWDHNTVYRHLKKRGVVMRGPSDWKY
jgi:transposase-like protein